mmetsp:Transcript_7078/g.12481  ORF Transcript_7078/g.12481 Transcript_7078/m.12481 type:complete len:80 (+) Transcript_7078:1592-1831(+)
MSNPQPATNMASHQFGLNRHYTAQGQGMHNDFSAWKSCMCNAQKEIRKMPASATCANSTKNTLHRWTLTLHRTRMAKKG